MTIQNSSEQNPKKIINEDLSARIVRVVDGDTVRVIFDIDEENEYPIRLYGLDAPELGRPGKEGQIGGVLSKDYLLKLCTESEEDEDQDESEKNESNDDETKEDSEEGNESHKNKSDGENERNFKRCTVRNFGVDRYKRLLSQIKVDEGQVDLSSQMVKDGYADVYQGANHIMFNYDFLLELKEIAKREKKGIWKIMKESPAEFKKRMREKKHHK